MEHLFEIAQWNTWLFLSSKKTHENQVLLWQQAHSDHEKSIFC